MIKCYTITNVSIMIIIIRVVIDNDKTSSLLHTIGEKLTLNISFNTIIYSIFSNYYERQLKKLLTEKLEFL